MPVAPRYEDILAKIGRWLCHPGKCAYISHSLMEWTSFNGPDAPEIFYFWTEPSDTTSNGNSVVAIIELGIGAFYSDKTG
jgi:hypothetical protein